MTRTMYDKTAAVMLIVAALAVVIAQNRAPVQAHFLLVTIEMPQILLLALTAAGGYVLGLVTPALLKRSRRVWPRPDAGSAHPRPGDEHMV